MAFIVIAMLESYLDASVKWGEHWSLKAIVRIKSAGVGSASPALGRHCEENVFVRRKDSKPKADLELFAS